MKIAIVTLGSIGDILPFVVVGTALQRRGHEVIFASNAGYEVLLRSAGFQFRSIWERSPSQTLDDVLASDPMEAWRRVEREMFAAAEEPQLDFLASELERGPLTVLATWSAYGARKAHQSLQVPVYLAYLSPGAFSAAPDLVDEPANGLYRLGFFPEWFCSHQSSWPTIELTGFPMFDDALVPALPPQLERFLKDGPPPVVITPGSYARSAGNFFLESLSACASLGLRAVLLTPYSEQIPARLPESVIHFKYVSLQRLLKRAELLICHGGIGTLAQALKAGVPQLVVPAFFDQTDNAYRVGALGTGTAIAPGAYNAKTAAAGIRELLSSELVGRNCIRARENFLGKDPVSQICDRLTQLV